MTKTAELPRQLGLLDGVSVVVGTMVGAGIFLLPSSIARSLPSAGLILAAWIVAGVVSFFGGLACAELGAMMPATGGQYVFLRETYGPLWGFLCGWTFFFVALSGAIAWLAVSFSLSLAYFVPLAPAAGRITAVALIASVTFVNYRGVRLGASVQNASTLLKVAGIAILIGAAFLRGRQAPMEWSMPVAAFPWTQFGVAMLACLTACDGWVTASFIAGEMRRPRRNVPLVLGLGILISAAIYLATNVAYMKVFSLQEIGAAERIGAAVAERTLGGFGGAFVSLTILVSIVSACNGFVMTSARVYFAQACDGLFFRIFRTVHPRFQTPSLALLGQGIFSSILVVSGTYDELMAYAIFAEWVFYAMTVTGVLVLRRRFPDRPRPYRVWGYPITPLLFLAFALWFTINTIITAPKPSLAGLGLIATGVPAYYLWRRRPA